MKTALRYKWRAEISSKKVSACGDVVSCDFSFCYRPNVANGLSESIPLMGPGVYGYFVTPLHDHEEFDHPRRVNGEVSRLVWTLPVCGVGHSGE